MNDLSLQRFKLGAWLRLVRWPNLLIIALTQLVAWWCIIYPLQGPLVLTIKNFALLCLSTLLIAAGGYIINDYFDVRIDVINKPDKVVLEKEIPRKLAIIVHSVLSVLALLLAMCVAIPEGHPEWLLLQLTCTFFLWRYSTTWKRQFMIGNVVVALMTALTILTLILYEPLLHSCLGRASCVAQKIKARDGFPNPAIVLLVFAMFAFLLTWMREIVKDMEDYKGDDAEGCVTMPIRWGLLRSTRFVQGLGLLATALLCTACVFLSVKARYFSFSALIIGLALILPLLLWIFNLQKAATAKHYHAYSAALKQIMMFGILSLLLLSSY